MNEQKIILLSETISIRRGYEENVDHQEAYAAEKDVI